MSEVDEIDDVLDVLEEVECDGLVGAVELFLNLRAVDCVTEDDPACRHEVMVVAVAEGVILLIKLLNFRYD